ncbi:MAG: hypothetical protein KDB00_01545 [Planctomycetales bacterium]|nr:hypothetical protein [Planctomycetales bacterium]
MTLSSSTPMTPPPVGPDGFVQGVKQAGKGKSVVSLGGVRSASRLLRQNTLLDVFDLGRQIDVLLGLQLTEVTAKLNRDLVVQLRSSFDDWLIVTRKELLAKINKVPKHARERWLQERLENSGLSMQWFSTLGVIDPDAVDHQSSAGQSSAGQSADADNERLADQQGVRLLADFLLHHSRVLTTRLTRLKSGNRDFRRNLSAVNSQTEREQVILRYAEQLGSGRRDLRRDQAAFRRWFDEEAVNDRFLRQVGQGELMLSFVMDRLGVVLDEMFSLVRSRNASAENLRQLWDRLGVEERVYAVWNYEGDPRVLASALGCIRRVLSVLPDECASSFLSQRFVADVNRAAFKANLDVWVQCSALDVLIAMRPGDAASLLVRRLSRVRGGDDLFVRRHALKTLERRFRQGMDGDLQLPRAENDPSEFVRQQFARTAFFGRHEANQQQWIRLAREDAVPQVRAAAILVATEMEGGLARRFESLECIANALRDEADSFVIRVALHTACLVLGNFYQSAPSEHVGHVSEYYRQRIEPAIESLVNKAESTAVRRYAAQARERIWATRHEAARQLITKIESQLRLIPIGHTKRFPVEWFKGLSDQQLGRILATISIDDFGFDVHRKPWGVYITRGPVFGLRLWRCFYEATHTATDKRQALRHTVGRINAAPLRIMSQICGELSETKVPGEPLTIDSDGTWRPFLPLMDDFIAVLNQSWFRAKMVRFATAQGQTCVLAPKSFVRRCIAAAHLNFRFAEYAKLRNWDDDTFPASSYINSLRDLGFRIDFESYSESDDDDATVMRFFRHGNRQPKRSILGTLRGYCSRFGRSAASKSETACRVREETGGEASLAFLMLGDSAFNTLRWSEIAQGWFGRFKDYFAAAFENTLEHLLLFTVAVILVVVFKHLWSNLQLRSARRRIPLSIGGWGTRGKSGTERLKAAVIGAMGHGLVSKTTGCEAMFIHADPYAEPLEIPLFRPFDKATIWEQSNLLRTVARMKPSVFLWECMALTPSYVDVLQRQWTCDDLATITNTYPDHEDLQGPAGHNVATTISGFVPQHSRLISSEEQMRPYVTESCREVKTTFRGVGWLESGLVTKDVLDRFPYKEHPDNVALVTAMAEELGVAQDVAVKAMGDYLVPDLGVLKTHPVSPVRTRKIQFTNGMSANERFGCMGNWKRLGFDRQDPWDDPTTWVCGIVNNRADRVPRSKVFAKILVEDLNADRFFLIGSNLEGMRGFIEDAWGERAETLTLRDSNHGNRWDRQYALDTLKNAAREFRQVIDREQLQKRLAACVHATLRWVGADTATVLSHIKMMMDNVDGMSAALVKSGATPSLVNCIAKHHRQWLASIDEYERMERRILDGEYADADRIEADYKMMLRMWFTRKLVILHDEGATGEEVVSFVVDETPPGFTNRLIGLQNIKGTGLDFVYRFQAWDTCHQACLAALSAQTSVAAGGLEALSAMPAIGQLCEQAMWGVVNQAKQSRFLLRPDLQAMIHSLEQRLKRLSSPEDAARHVETMPIDEATEDQTPRADVRLSRRARWNEWAIRYGEEFLDLTDSLKRRQKADQVYKDLAEGRIGRQRAIAVLRSINKRQKGGWLVK